MQVNGFENMEEAQLRECVQNQPTSGKACSSKAPEK